MNKNIIIIILSIIVLALLLSGCTESNTDTTDEGTSENGGSEDNGDSGVNGEGDEGDTNDDSGDDGSEDDTGLVAHWSFDETSGTTVPESMSGYDGTIIGDATWTMGQINNALSFDGEGDYVQLPQDAIEELGALTEGTIAFWFTYESILADQTIMPIFYIGNQNADDHDSIFIIEIGHSDTEAEQLTVDPTNKNMYVTWTDWVQDSLEPVLCYDSDQNLEENTWIHFAVVVGSDGNTGYLNGAELTNRRYNFGSDSDQMFLSEIPVKELFTLGYGKTHEQISPTFVYFKGMLDDMRIYNRALSSSEVQELAEALT